jgi:hypothetical protein
MAVVKDARQFPRFAVDLQVAVSTGPRRYQARSRDISRTGICLITKQAIRLESEIELQLVLAFEAGGVSEPLVVAGRVVWCTGLFGAFQIGVMFAELDDERARHMEMFIGLLDGTLGQSGRPLEDDEDTDRPFDPDDPFRP